MLSVETMDVEFLLCSSGMYAMLAHKQTCTLRMFTIVIIGASLSEPHTSDTFHAINHVQKIWK